LHRLLEPIRPDLEQVERVFHNVLADVEEPLGSMLRRSLCGGKRLRPALVVLVGRAFAAPIAPFHGLAAATDLLHTATLIHDDLVDGAARRRGQEALHTVWPASVTVLAGDYLLGQAVSLIAGLGHPHLLKVFADTLRIICAGEIRQLVVARDQHRSREGYTRSIEAKTASLFGASTEMAAILAGAGEPQVAALRRFGHELGLAYQIVDDVLDLIGDEAELGKPAGSDLRQGIATLPVLCYLEQAGDDSPVHAVLAGQDGEAHVRAAIAAIRASGAIEVTLEEAHAHARHSQEALATLPPGNEARQVLCELAEYAVERRR